MGMKRSSLTFLIASFPFFAFGADWAPEIDKVTSDKLAPVTERKLEAYRHGVKKEWGYPNPQEDTFVIIHPKAPRKNAPLYVVLHSAGHDVISCVKCTTRVGNHDIYHSPDDFFALYLDCRANRGDWWWGGMHARDKKLTEKNSGGDPMPVERRAVDTVKWTISKYGIDPNRVYLCGNSMGGSGTLGIGLPNGDLFAAIKANVPAGIEHVSNRMYFGSQPKPKNVRFPDPPVTIDYSAPNDGWSAGHERFVKAINDRKYPLHFYWGPFGHANNHARIMEVNDLINSLDWLEIKKNEAYAAFSNASCNDPLPWPNDLKSKDSGQLNAWFRWKTLSDTKKEIQMSLFLVSGSALKTKFAIAKEASADVTLRRVQNLGSKPGQTLQWTFGQSKGTTKVGADGAITIPGLKITAKPVTLKVGK